MAFSVFFNYSFHYLLLLYHLISAPDCLIPCTPDCYLPCSPMSLPLLPNLPTGLPGCFRMSRFRVLIAINTIFLTRFIEQLFTLPSFLLPPLSSLNKGSVCVVPQAVYCFFIKIYSCNKKLFLLQLRCILIIYTHTRISTTVLKCQRVLFHMPFN